MADLILGSTTAISESGGTVTIDNAVQDNITRLGTVTTGTLNGTIFTGITTVGGKFMPPNSTTSHHTFTVSNNSKYILFLAMNAYHADAAGDLLPAAAQVTVDGSGAVTATMVFNDFGASLSVTSPGANAVKWQNTNLSYGTYSQLIQVGGA